MSKRKHSPLKEASQELKTSNSSQKQPQNHKLRTKSTTQTARTLQISAQRKPTPEP